MFARVIDLRAEKVIIFIWHSVFIFSVFSNLQTLSLTYLYTRKMPRSVESYPPQTRHHTVEMSPPLSQVKRSGHDLHLWPLTLRTFSAMLTHMRNICAKFPFLPRCMECRRGLAMRILSVRLSVRLSNAWIVTKRKKDMFRFLYHTEDHLV